MDSLQNLFLIGLNKIYVTYSPQIYNQFSEI
jgi:hypothetical protein